MEVTKNKTNSLLLAMAILFVIFQSVGVTLGCIGDHVDFTWIAETIIAATLAILLFISYRTHTKNTMKSLMGAILIMYLIYYLEWSAYYFQYIDYYLELYGNQTAFIIHSILQVLIAITIILINIVHYLISAKNSSSPSKVRFIKILYYCYVAFIFAQCVCSLFFKDLVLVTISRFCVNIADVYLIRMVIYIEKLLDQFRIEREMKKLQAE